MIIWCIFLTCCLINWPTMKQPAQFCLWLFHWKTRRETAKYEVITAKMVITINYLVVRLKHRSITVELWLRSILWTRVCPICSQNEKSHELYNWWLHLFLGIVAVCRLCGSGIEPLSSKMGVYLGNSYFELLSLGIELIPTLLKTYVLHNEAVGTADDSKYLSHLHMYTA